MPALPTVTHEHHDTLLPHIEELAAIARIAGSAPADELTARLDTEVQFVLSHLVPHMDRAETTLYPELERLFQNRHSMSPMRREHEELRRLIAELARLGHERPTGTVRNRLRRVLFRMYATVQIHLAEEEAYLPILEGNLSPAELEQLARDMDHEVGES